MFAGVRDGVIRGVFGRDVSFRFHKLNIYTGLVRYTYIGDTILSPAFLSLPPKWAKATFAIALGNFLMSVYLIPFGFFSPLKGTLHSTGALCCHTAAKLVFVRFFRGTVHMYNHTARGWTTWILLCFLSVAAAFVFAVAVPIFPYLIGITAALFAAWYTYGLAGFFWLHDTYHLGGGSTALRNHLFLTILSILIIAAGAFICVAGTYVSVKVGEINQTPENFRPSHFCSL